MHTLNLSLNLSISQDGETRKPDILVREMKHAFFVVDLHEKTLKSKKLNHEQKSELQSLGNDLVMDIILPLIKEKDMHSSIFGFINTIQAQMATFSTRKSAEYVTEAMIMALVQLLSGDDDNIRVGALRALGDVQSWAEVPHLFKLLNSENPQTVEQGISCLGKHMALYNIKVTQDEGVDLFAKRKEFEIDLFKVPDDSFVDVRHLLQQLDGLLDPNEILRCTNDQIRLFYSIFFTKLLNQTLEDNSCSTILINAWGAFLHKTHMDPYLSQLFYWMASVSSFFLKRRLGKLEIRTFLKRSIFIATENFFSELNSGWDTIPLGEYREANFVDPLSETCQHVKRWKVVKIFDSKAKPLLVEFVYDDDRNNFVMFKRGDDLRKDNYIQCLFSVLNNLWDNTTELEPKLPKPYIYTYKCVPLAYKFGCIEYVPNSKPVLEVDWEEIKNLDPILKDKFLGSLAGSYLASFVLGIRDRHQDNMLVKDGYIFFHIDFGHLWNQGPLLDAPRIAIPTKLKTTALSPEEWEKLEEILITGYGVLYNSSYLIKNAAVQLFKQITDTTLVAEFLEGGNSLMTGVTLSQAQTKLRNIFQDSIGSVKGIFKNVVHKFGKSEFSKTSPRIPIPTEMEPGIFKRQRSVSVELGWVHKSVSEKTSPRVEEEDKGCEGGGVRPVVLGPAPPLPPNPKNNPKKNLLAVDSPKSRRNRRAISEKKSSKRFLSSPGGGTRPLSTQFAKTSYSEGDQQMNSGFQPFTSQSAGPPQITSLIVVPLTSQSEGGTTIPPLNFGSLGTTLPPLNSGPFQLVETMSQSVGTLPLNSGTLVEPLDLGTSQL